MEPGINNDSFFLPVQASASAGEVDDLFGAVFNVSALFFVVLVLVVLFAVVVYRRRPGGPPVSQFKRNVVLELGVGATALLFIAGVFVSGARGQLELHVAPRGAMVVQAEGDRCNWKFTYPDGFSVDNVLRVPLDGPVELVLSGGGAVQGLSIPDFRIHETLVPGETRSVWFQAGIIGEFPIYCNRYGHIGPKEIAGKVLVKTAGEFDEYVELGGLSEAEIPLAKLGAKLYEKKICNTCHSTDGTKRVGPTFKGLFGRTEKLSEGSTIIVDDAYLKESILESAAKVVDGYQPVMPPYAGQLSDRQVAALIEFIKAL